MNDFYFKWDLCKSRKKEIKFGISFDEAQTVFLNEDAIRYFDLKHSEDEYRFNSKGKQKRNGRLLKMVPMRERMTIPQRWRGRESHTLNT